MAFELGAVSSQETKGICEMLRHFLPSSGSAEIRTIADSPLKASLIPLLTSGVPVVAMHPHLDPMRKVCTMAERLFLDGGSHMP